MATTTEEADAGKLAAGHDRARLAALQWAERAETWHSEAARQRDYANDPTRQHNAYLRQAVAEARTQAETYAVRSTQARQLAEMWARVAAILVPPLEPVETVLERTDG